MYLDDKLRCWTKSYCRLEQFKNSRKANSQLVCFPFPSSKAPNFLVPLFGCLLPKPDTLLLETQTHEICQSGLFCFPYRCCRAFFDFWIRPLLSGQWTCLALISITSAWSTRATRTREKSKRRPTAIVRFVNMSTFVSLWVCFDYYSNSFQTFLAEWITFEGFRWSKLGNWGRGWRRKRSYQPS